MYVPAAFRESDTGRLHEFIRHHGFALVTTYGTQGLVASHLPVLLEATRGSLGTIVGHFAKANEQAVDFGCEALVVFSGPHAYISPTWYETPNTVPTWNYVAVHAYGVLMPTDDRTVLAKVLESTVNKYEGSSPSPWLFDANTEFHQKMMEGIVGFEIPITRLEGKWKLNQNHPVERRERVIAALNAVGGEDSLEIARLMAASLPPREKSED